MPSRISGIGPAGHRAQGAGAARAAPGTRMSSRCRSAASTSCAGGGEAHAFDPTLIHTLQTRGRHRQLPDLPALSPRRVRKLPPVALRDLLDFRRDRRKPIPVDEVESITEIRKRLVAPGISLGALSPEAHETLSIAMNRIGAKLRHRRGRRGPGALQAARQRRQCVLGDQADRLGPLRRDRRISEQLPRDRDQGRAGRQARRRRPAARLQGHRR